MKACWKFVTTFFCVVYFGCSSELPIADHQDADERTAPEAEQNLSGENSSTVPQLGSAQTSSSVENSTTTIPGSTIVGNPSAPVSISAASAVLDLSFVGTSFGINFEADKTRLSDASNTAEDSGEIVEYQRTQIDNGMPTVEFLNTDSATASSIAPSKINVQRLNVQATVPTSTSKSASKSLFHARTIEEPKPVESANTTKTSESENSEQSAIVSSGNYTLGSTGDYHALSAESLFIVNLDDSSVDHVNPVTGTLLTRYDFTETPGLLEFVANTNSLYVGLASTNAIVRINLDSGLRTIIDTNGAVLSLAAWGNRIYFTTLAAVYKYELASADEKNIRSVHGVLGGDLILPNSVTNEIIAVKTGSSPGTVYRYSFDIHGNAVEEESNRDLGLNARDLAISSDGLQLAVLAESGNGNGYTVHDVDSFDLSVSNGAWNTGSYPVSGDFSDSRSLFAASNTDDLMIFDTANYTQTATYITNNRLCGLNYYDFTNVRFSEDDQHVFGKLECGADKERSVIFFYKTP